MRGNSINKIVEMIKITVMIIKTNSLKYWVKNINELIFTLLKIHPNQNDIEKLKDGMEDR